MIRGIIDHIEGDSIIVTTDKGRVVIVSSTPFPSINEGDVINISLERDEAEKEVVRERVAEYRTRSKIRKWEIDGNMFEIDIFK